MPLPPEPGFDSYSPIQNYNTFAQNQRYEFARVTIEGVPYFLKKAKVPEVAPKLQREVLWHDFMQVISTDYSDLQVRSPKIHDIQDDQILFEYIDAPFITTMDDAETLRPKIPRLTQLLVAMDTAGESWKPTINPDEKTDNAPFNHIDKGWKRWVEKPLSEGLISQATIDLAASILNDYGQYLTPGMQHGDFNPWHIFELGDKWVIFDGENASTQKSRFYDLAYFYSRVFTRTRNHQIPAELLRSFVKAIDLAPDDFFKAFVPLLTSRALGMYLDAINDRDKVDYTTDANELFERCCSRSLAALTES